MQRLFLIVESRRDLRSNADLTFMPRLNRTKFGDNNLGNRCYKYWSQLDTETHNCTSFNQFKSCMRNFDGFAHLGVYDFCKK